MTLTFPQPSAQATTAPRRRGALAVVTAGVVLAMAAACDPFDVGSSDEQERSDTFSGVESLLAEHEYGDVTVMGGDELVVERTLRSSRNHEPTETISQDGPALRVSAECPSSFRPATCAVDYRITVPAGVSVEVRAQANQVVVTGAVGPVEVTTDSGPVEIAEVDGDVSVTTLAGAVSIHHDGPDRIRASSDSGDINLIVDSTPGSVTATTAAGQVTLTAPAGSGPYQVTAVTAVGEVDVDVEQSDGGVPVALTTDSGDITVAAVE